MFNSVVDYYYFSESFLYINNVVNNLVDLIVVLEKVIVLDLVVYDIDINCEIIKFGKVVLVQ